MKIAIIGCGYVFDHYMATWGRHKNLHLKGVSDTDPLRLAQVAKAYNLFTYASNEEVFADDEVTIVANFTSIESHYDVTRAALMAGKHVYSEKPLVTNMEQACALFALAEERGLRLSCAPSNAMSDTTQTMWKAVLDGAVGDVRLVYAEFDDNVIYKMHPETWRSRSGAPWPYLHEYEQGCTYEHVGYHLTWLCAMFGPVESVTSFSKQVLPDKTDLRLQPSDTPDFSVACLNFCNGVVARVTCSIGVPYDHRMRIFGNLGMLTADTYRHYQCPVYLERFSQLTLNARKAMAVRKISMLQWLLGIGGRKLKLLRLAPPGSDGQNVIPRVRWWSPRDILKAFRIRQLGQQDKAIGLAELVDALNSKRPSFPPHDFTLHLTELTIAIQVAGVSSSTTKLKSTFVPVIPNPKTLAAPIDYANASKPSWLERIIEKRLIKMHRN